MAALATIVGCLMLSPLASSRPAAQSLQLSIIRSYPTSDAGVSIHVKLVGFGPIGPDQSATVMIAQAPDWHWHQNTNPWVSYQGTIDAQIYVPSGPPGPNADTPERETSPEHNFRIYVTYQGVNSPTKLVYVWPEIQFGVARNDGGSGPVLIGQYFVYMHWMRRYPRTRVYFYYRPAGSRVFRRFAVKRLHVLSSTYQTATLIATARLSDSRAGTMLACVPHRIVSDMGTRFFDRHCGPPTRP